MPGFLGFPVKFHLKIPTQNSRVRNILEDDFNEESPVTFVLLTNDQASEGNKKEFEDIKRKKELGLFDWELIDLSGIKAKHKQAQSVEKNRRWLKLIFANKGGLTCLKKLKNPARNTKLLLPSFAAMCV